jgi:hypothetical protein
MGKVSSGNHPSHYEVSDKRYVCVLCACARSRIWDSKISSRVSRDLDPKMTALARARSNCKRQIHPLVREGAPHQQTRDYLTVIKNLVVSPRWVFYSKTHWPTVCGRRGIRPLHRDHHWYNVLPLWLALYQSHTTNEMQDLWGAS